MPTVSIVYHSGTGHNAVFAEAVAQGARQIAGTTVHLLRIEGHDITEGRFKNEALFATLNASDAIVFGAPTYMGGASGQFKCFADATGGIWYQQLWKDKLAGGFTVSGTPSGDKVSTLQYFFTLSQQHGMLWIGTGVLPNNPAGVNRFSFSMGPVGQAGQEPVDIAPPAEDKLTGELFGQRIASAAARWTAAR